MCGNANSDSGTKNTNGEGRNYKYKISNDFILKCGKEYKSAYVMWRMKDACGEHTNFKQRCIPLGAYVNLLLLDLN